MSNDNTIDCSKIGKFKDELTAILREGAQRLSSGAPDPDRDRPGPGTDSEGSFQRRQAGDLPLVGGSAVCAQESRAGGLGALAVPEGGQNRRDGRSAVGLLTIADGAMGFWSAVDRVYPETRHQRCRVHKTANVLAAMPKAIQPGVKSALRQIRMAETRDQAGRAFDGFLARYQD